MSSSKWINIGNNLVKKCLSYNISKFRRKLINICRDTIIFCKYVDVLICKFVFLFPRSIWLCKNILNGQMRHDIISPTHTLSKYEEKNGSPCSSRCTFYRHVFAHICYVIHELASTDIYLQRTLIPLLIVIKRWTWYQIVQKNMRNILWNKGNALGGLACITQFDKMKNSGWNLEHYL